MASETETCLFLDVNLITLASPGDWGVIRDGALAVCGGEIAWVGPRADLPSAMGGARQVSCGGQWMTPGLVDCHTHLVWGGDRIGEFERRLAGESYAELTAGGGGILSTVRATRSASEDALYTAARKRLDHFLAEGVTTIEIKSGYGLDRASEKKMLRVARRLGESAPLDVTSTFLGAHVLPPEYAQDRDAYLQLLCQEMIPEIAGEGLAEAVDCYCERIAFTLEETRQVLTAAQRQGLAVKLHAEQFSDMGGAELAANMGADSADHVEYVSANAIAAMARAGTVAVLLPGAFYSLGETQHPPIRALREAGVAMAVASDCNPGTSPVFSLRLMMNMACTMFGLTPLEALQGTTVNAARALGMRDRGVLAPGMRADLALWDISEPAELAYAVGGDLCRGRVSAGEGSHFAGDHV